MAQTPVYGWPYPVGTDRVMDGDNAIENLAKAIENRVRFAAATQFVAGPVASVAVTFPAGRFAGAPIVLLTTGTGSNVAVVAVASAVTATGFTAFFYALGGTWSTGGIPLFWLAIGNQAGPV